MYADIAKATNILGCLWRRQTKLKTEIFEKYFLSLGPWGVEKFPRAIGSPAPDLSQKFFLGATQRRRSCGGRPEGHRKSGAGLLLEICLWGPRKEGAPLSHTRISCWGPPEGDREDFRRRGSRSTTLRAPGPWSTKLLFPTSEGLPRATDKHRASPAPDFS